VPAQQRVCAGQEAPPGRTREEPAEGAEEQAVVRLEAGPMDLAFENTELVAEGENLDLKRGFGLPAEDKEVEQGADEAGQPPRARSNPVSQTYVRIIPVGAAGGKGQVVSRIVKHRADSPQASVPMTTVTRPIA